MCRWAAYRGPAVFLQDIVTAPCHSLIAQSHHALEAKSATNGDGFGIAWYGERAEPGLYRDILPAWSDPNLKSLCRQIRSPLFLAHVRASTHGATSRANCHPFAVGRWSFMHNGQIGDFDRLRRSLESSLSDENYARRTGSTDSELLFLLMLDAGLENDPHEACAKTVAKVIAAAENTGVKPFIRMTAAFSDGVALHAVRYATDAFAPTLYHASPGGGEGCCLVSEPLDGEGANWTAIAPGSFVTLAPGQPIRIAPFKPLNAAARQAA